MDVVWAWHDGHKTLTAGVLVLHTGVAPKLGSGSHGHAQSEGLVTAQVKLLPLHGSALPGPLYVLQTAPFTIRVYLTKERVVISAPQ